MIRYATLLGIALLLVASALASDDEAAVIFDRFDHAEHAATFRRHDVGCVVCHAMTPVAEGTAANAAGLGPNEAVCHTCHAPGEGGLGVGDGLRAAPARCATCHPTVDPPTSHAAGWLELHGSDARADAASCENCHTRSSCVDCHERRQNGAFTVHDPSWIKTHGVAVRAAPATCDSCHAQTECLSCHTSTTGFGRAP